MAIVVPETVEGETRELTNIVVSIDKEANIRFKNTAVRLPLLLEGLKRELQQRDKTTIIIQADRRVAYDHVVQVIDVAKIAGAKNILLVTTKKTDAGSH